MNQKPTFFHKVVVPGISKWELCHLISVYNSPKARQLHCPVKPLPWSGCFSYKRDDGNRSCPRTSSPDRLCEPSFQWQHQLELRSQILPPFVYSRFQKKQTQGLLLSTIAIPFKNWMSGHSYFFFYQQSICSLFFFLNEFRENCYSLLLCSTHPSSLGNEQLSLF